MCYDDLMTSMQLELNGARMQRNMQLFAHTLASFVKILMKAKKNTFRVLHFVTYKCLCMEKILNLWFDCEVYTRMSGVEIMQKPSSGGFTVEQQKFVIYISERNGRTKIDISHPRNIFLQSYT